MDRRLVGAYVVGVASGLIFLSAFAHAGPGWTALREALKDQADPAVLRAVGVGWHFGSISMATFGFLGLWSAVQLRKGVVEARSTPLLIGAAYVVFGVAAMLSTGGRPHFWLFIGLGALLLAGALVWSRERA